MIEPPITRNRRVVITAVEQVSAYGCGVDELLARETDVNFSVRLPHVPVTPDYEFHRMSGVQPNAEIRQMDELTQATVACAHLAAEAESIEEGERVAIVLGGGYGCHATNQAFINTLLEKGPRFVKPVVFRNTVSNAVAGHLAITLGITGTNTVLNSGMVAGLQALALAYDELHWGRSEIALTGASDWVSDLLVQRYRAQAAEDKGAAGPLLDGAVVMILRAVDEQTPGWRVLGYNLGRVSSARKTAQLAGLLEGTLARGSIGLDAVSTILLNDGWSRGWVRGHECAELEGIARHLLDGVTCPPPCEATAVVPALALVEALLRLPTGQPLTLFTRGEPVQPVDNDVLVFIALGTDGNAVSLMLSHQPPMPGERGI